MSQDSDFRQMTEESLAQRCAQETNFYFKHHTHDTRYCFELFRRAIEEKNSLAWKLICEQYQALVSGWVNQHRGFPASGESVDYFVNGAFGKISGTISPDRFHSFTDLGALLRYLKMCVHSIITDYNRVADYMELFGLEDVEKERSMDLSPEELAMDHSDSHRIWAATAERVHDEKERTVLHGSFVLELKPQEILDYFPRLFADVDEVYRIKQNVISRLRRDVEFRKLLEPDD